MNPTPSESAPTNPLDEACREPQPERNHRSCSLAWHLVTSLILFTAFTAGLITATVSGLHTKLPKAATTSLSTVGGPPSGSAINDAGGGVRLVSWDTPTPPPNATTWPSSYGIWYQWPDRSWRQQPSPAPTGWPTSQPTSWTSDRPSGWPTDWSQPPIGWPAPQQDGWPTGATWPPPPATSVVNVPTPTNGYWPNTANWPTGPSYLPTATPDEPGEGKLTCPVAITRDRTGRDGAVGIRIDVTMENPPRRSGAPARGPMIVGCGPTGRLQVAVCTANPNYDADQTDYTTPRRNGSHRNPAAVNSDLSDRIDNIVDSALDTALGATSKADTDTDSGDDQHRRRSNHNRERALDHGSERGTHWNRDKSTNTGNSSGRWICPSAPGR